MILRSWQPERDRDIHTISSATSSVIIDSVDRDNTTYGQTKNKSSTFINYLERVFLTCLKTEQMASMVSSRQRQQQLVRRVVGQRLAKYYAQPSDRVVGKSTGEPVSLSSLWGEWHWRRVFQKQYEEREGHWLTPVELFQPYYSYAMADFCISTLQNARTNDQNLSGTGSIDNLDLNVEDRPIEIFELGGGRGTNAKLVLSYLQEMCPELYENDNFKYTLVDSSPSLHQLQKDLLGESEHVDKVKFELKDLMDIAEEK